MSPTPVPHLLSIHFSSCPVFPVYYNVKTYKKKYSKNKLHLKHLNHYSVKKLHLKRLDLYNIKELHFKHYSCFLCEIEKYSVSKMHSSPCAFVVTYGSIWGGHPYVPQNLCSPGAKG